MPIHVKLTLLDAEVVPAVVAMAVITMKTTLTELSVPVGVVTTRLAVIASGRWGRARSIPHPQRADAMPVRTV